MYQLLVKLVLVLCAKTLVVGEMGIKNFRVDSIIMHLYLSQGFNQLLFGRIKVTGL